MLQKSNAIAYSYAIFLEALRGLGYYPICAVESAKKKWVECQLSIRKAASARLKRCNVGPLTGFPPCDAASLMERQMQEYERQKAAFIAANPNATPAEYTAAMIAIARKCGV